MENKENMEDLFNNVWTNYNIPYYTEQLITCIGNKRRLLPFLNIGVERVKELLQKNKLVILDGFAGSGVVSRFFKSKAQILHSNDLENYSYLVNKCYLANKSEIDLVYISNTIKELNKYAKNNLIEGFITKNYAPVNDNDIKAGERVFYTHYNAEMLDTLKQRIYETIPEDKQAFFLAPLIVEASIHTNTSGVFKGFYKKNGIGHFGGAGENALKRIKGKIELPVPIFSDDECEVKIFKEDINMLLKRNDITKYDLAYYDPPYNQHPYGSNYFMLNILATKDETIPIQNGVSGIAENWNRSAYNKKEPAIKAMDDLLKNTPAKYILVSYNNEGIIPFDIFMEIAQKYGQVELLQKDYNTFRGCRNLNCRSIKVKELLWCIKK